MQHPPASTAKTVKQSLACAATCFCFFCLVITFVRTTHPTDPSFTSSVDRVTRALHRQTEERTAMFSEAPLHVATAPASARPD